MQINKHPFSFCKRYLSLLATPVLLFISTSIPLYLDNQSELGHQISVLAPFVSLVLITSAIGALVWMLPESKARAISLWLYYLAGPCFLLFSLVKNYSIFNLNQPGGFYFLVGAYLSLSIFLAYRINVRLVSGFIALLAIMFISADLGRFALNETTREENKPVSNELITNNSLPNIYHIILDAYQSDIFETTIDNQLESDLAGFTFYSDTSSLYNMTSWSIPSVFLGAAYNFDSSLLEYQHKAFNEEDSLLKLLKDNDYSTFALMRNLYPRKIPLFDSVLYHDENINIKPIDNTNSFISLWVYRNMPDFVTANLANRNLFIDRKDITAFDKKVFLSDTAPLESFLSFRNFIRTEKSLPAHGRYTFIHLLMPHSPYVFSSDCSKYGGSDVVEQSRCSTKLIVKLIEVLKSLKRFEESLIIIHGDHGDFYTYNDSILEKTKQRSHKTLLLMKAGGVDATKGLRISNRKTSLLDILPTVGEFIGISKKSTYQGESILSEKAISSRKRMLEYYKVLGDKKMVKYVINENELVKLTEIEIPKTQIPQNSMKPAPIIPVNEIVEAELGRLSSSVKVANNLPGVSGQYVSGGKMEYRFNINQESVVRISARLIASGQNNDSSFLRINGENSNTWHMKNSREWGWQISPTKWKLKSGTHILSIEYREPVYIDQLNIVVDEFTTTN